MRNQLSRRLYNSSLTLAISFGFYALIFAYTLSCEGEEVRPVSEKSTTEEAVQPNIPADTAAVATDEVISYVEKVYE